MQPHRPHISVILTSQGRPDYVPIALRSILRQSFSNWELIIIDSSFDKQLWRLFESTQKRDARVRLFRHTHGNVSKAANYGLRQAHAPWITFQDDDDYSHRHRLRACWRIVQRAPQYDIVLPMLRLFYGSASKKMEIRKFTSHLKQGLLRRSLVEQLGGFREFFPVAEDTDLRLRLLDAGAKVYELDRSVYYYRQYDEPVHLSHRLDRAQYHLVARLSAWCRAHKRADPVESAGGLIEALAYCKQMPPRARMDLLRRSLLTTYAWQLELAWQNDDAMRAEAIYAQAETSLRQCGLGTSATQAEVRKMRMLSGSWATGVYDFMVELGRCYQKATGKRLPNSYTTPQSLFAYCAHLSQPDRDWLVRRFLLKACKQRAHLCLKGGNIALIPRIARDVAMLLHACGYPSAQARRLLWQFYLSVAMRYARLLILRT